MKLIWHSNAPFAGSGYGTQTEIFSRLLMQAGHSVKASSFYGLQGGSIQAGPLEILPSTFDSYGNDAIGKYWEWYDPDVFLLLIDIWVYAHDVLKIGPISSWCPVDAQPIPLQVLEKLNSVRHIMAMSRFGEREMRKVGLDPFYVPHAYDPNQFKSIDRSKARAELKLKDNQFTVVCVAANKGYPPRKNLDRLLKAWSIFVQSHPDAMLLLHTLSNVAHGGLDVISAAQYYDIPAQNIMLPDALKFHTGFYGPDFLNKLYNAADAFILPSAGEGFGIPAIEAQGAGCPVILTDFTAQSELAEAGYKIPVDPTDDLLINAQLSEQALPKVTEILKGLDWAFDNRNDPKLRYLAHTFAGDYRADVVFSKHMLPALETMAAINQEYKPKKPKLPTPQNPACKDGHDWAGTGVYNQLGALCVPCKRPTCEAELLVSPNGQQRINPNGFKIQIHGLPLDIEDDAQGGVVKIVCREVEQNYHLDQIDFKDGDIVIDIGAQVGIVSTYLGKKYPFLDIRAYEPVPENYQRLRRNLKANGVTNVKTFNYAVTGLSGIHEVAIRGNIHGNSGGFSSFTNGDTGFIAPAKDILEVVPVSRKIKLFKIDCEGMEHEILRGLSVRLQQIEYLAGEFHINDTLASKGYSIEALMAYVGQYVSPEKLFVNGCKIAD
jgi:FkbM family methyltransferase